MFILTIDGKEDKGAYSVENESGDKILYLFEEEDDATRFAIQLEDCLLYTSPSPRDYAASRMPSSA